MRLFRPASRLQVHLTEGRPTSLELEAKENREELRGKFCGRQDRGAAPANGGLRFQSQTTLRQSRLAPGTGKSGTLLCSVPAGRLPTETQDNVALYRIYRDLASGHWFADASYD